jgi:predicted DsbA family dithiol-disulfide isomerase
MSDPEITLTVKVGKTEVLSVSRPITGVATDDYTKVRSKLGPLLQELNAAVIASAEAIGLEYSAQVDPPSKETIKAEKASAAAAEKAAETVEPEPEKPQKATKKATVAP